MVPGKKNDARLLVQVEPTVRVLASTSPNGDSDVVVVHGSKGVRLLEGFDRDMLREFLVWLEKPRLANQVRFRLRRHGYSEQNSQMAVKIMVKIGLLRSIGNTTESPETFLKVRQLFQSSTSTLYRDIMVVGSGEVASEIASVLRRDAFRVTRLLVDAVELGTQPPLHPLEIYSGKQTSPPSEVHLTLGSNPIRFSKLPSVIRKQQVVIFAACDTSIDFLLAFRDMVHKLGARLIPVVGFGDSIEVGPLILPSLASTLESRVYPLLLSGHAKSVRLISSMDSRSVLAQRTRLVAATIRAMLRDRSLSMLQSIARVCDRGLQLKGIPLTEDVVALAGKEWELDIRNHLNPTIWKKPTVVAGIRRALKLRKLVAMAEAFEPRYAQAMYEQINRYMAWKEVSKNSGPFSYRYHMSTDGPPAIDTYRLIVSSPKSLEFVRWLSGRRIEQAANMAASWYEAGDYSSPHNDLDNQRQVAAVWNLSKGWKYNWGGEFFWCPTSTWVTPSFNALTMFNVNHHSWHAVLPVHIGAIKKRLAVYGWWSSLKRIKVAKRTPIRQIDKKIVAIPTNRHLRLNRKK